jgi:anti-sigma factor (TIGR02949 family)
MTCDEARNSLDAYVDGELDLSRQLEMEAHVEGCANCQNEVGQITNFKTLLRSNMPAYLAPPELQSKIRATLQKESRTRHEWFFSYGKQLAYAAALIALGFALSWTWFSVAPRKDNQLVADAISNHARSLMVSHLLDCTSSDQHTVRPWFNGKLDYSPPVPDLAQAGYSLKGGRIDMLDRRAVAAIVYEHGEHVINLFVWPAGDQKIDIDLQSQHGYHYCAGNISGFNYFCISDVSGPDLEAFEDAVREHFNL